MLVATIVALFIVIMIHELGHFYFCRRAGVYVKSFSIGFGKPIWKRTDKHGTEWRVGWLWLGGYVQPHGQSDILSQKEKDAYSKEDRKGHFAFISYTNKLLIMFGGVLFNFITAFILLWGLFFFKGIPSTGYTISEIVVSTENEPSKFQVADKLQSINGVSVAEKHPVRILRESESDNFTVVVKRGEEDVKINLVLPQENRKMGVMLSSEIKDFSPQNIFQSWHSAGIEFYKQLSKVFNTVKGLITGVYKMNEMGGLITIAKMSGDALSSGVYIYIFWIVVLHISIGFFNLLPIPGLDGGHIVFTIIESIIRRPLPPIFIKVVFNLGFILLIGLMIYVLWNDIVRML
ncbi:MAG: site-2 protease family protein [Alphaproteobacteria bacterium]|nr:site-2 protease family protein [Alphaproteobacteria bacterium]MBL0717901.1 site-2 protease family protein [Alphaproteobacteria bacterium]